MLTGNHRAVLLLLSVVACAWSVGGVWGKPALTALPASPADFAWACDKVPRFPSPDGVTPGEVVAFPTYQCFPKNSTAAAAWNTAAAPLPIITVLYDDSFLDAAMAHTGSRAFIESHLSYYLPQLACAHPLPSGLIADCSEPSPGVFVQMIDNACSEQQGLANTFRALTLPGTKPLVVLGSSCSTSTNGGALVASVYKVPIIGSMATSAEFSDKARYPYFTRTTYSVPDEIMSLFGFAAYYGLQRVILLTVSTSTGVTFVSFAQQRASSAGVKIVRSLQFKESPSVDEVNALLDVVLEVNVRTIVVHAVPTAEPILKQARLRGLMGEGWAWLMSGGSISRYFGIIPPANADSLIFEAGYFNPANPYAGQVYKLDKLAVKVYFNRSIPYHDLICDGMWDAAHTTLAAASNLLDTAPGGAGSLNYSQAVAMLSNGDALQLHIRNITLPSACGDTLHFHPVTADRFNPTMAIRKGLVVDGRLNTQLVALWENGAFKPLVSDLTWLGGATSAPSGSYSRVLVNEGLTLAVIVLSSLTMAVTVAVGGLVFWHRTAAVIKATTVSFSLLICVSCLLLSGSAILFALQPGAGVDSVRPVSGATLTDDPVLNQRSLQYPALPPNAAWSTSGEVLLVEGTRSDALCVARVWLLPLGVILLLAPIALKSLRLTRIFNSTKLQVSSLPTALLVRAVAGMLAVQTVLCVLYTAGVGGSTPGLQLVLSVSEATAATLGSAEWVCHQSNWFLGATIGFNGLVAAAVAVLAWRSRNLPAKFNEAQQLASLCVFIFIYCVLLLPLQFLLSEGGQSPTSVAVLRAMGVLLGVWMTLAILFLPKVWQIRDGGLGDPKLGGTHHPTVASKYNENGKDPAPTSEAGSGAAGSAGERTRSLRGGPSTVQVTPLFRSNGAGAYVSGITSPSHLDPRSPDSRLATRTLAHAAGTNGGSSTLTVPPATAAAAAAAAATTLGNETQQQQQQQEPVQEPQPFLPGEAEE